jgi:hypothetical protein
VSDTPPDCGHLNEECPQRKACSGANTCFRLEDWLAEHGEANSVGPL